MAYRHTLDQTASDQAQRFYSPPPYSVVDPHSHISPIQAYSHAPSVRVSNSSFQSQAMRVPQRVGGVTLMNASPEPTQGYYLPAASQSAFSSVHPQLQAALHWWNGLTSQSPTQAPQQGQYSFRNLQDQYIAAELRQSRGEWSREIQAHVGHLSRRQEGLVIGLYNRMFQQQYLTASQSYPVAPTTTSAGVAPTQGYYPPAASQSAFSSVHPQLQTALHWWNELTRQPSTQPPRQGQYPFGNLQEQYITAGLRKQRSVWSSEIDSNRGHLTPSQCALVVGFYLRKVQQIAVDLQSISAQHLKTNAHSFGQSQTKRDLISRIRTNSMDVQAQAKTFNEVYVYLQGKGVDVSNYAESKIVADSLLSSSTGYQQSRQRQYPGANAWGSDA